MAREYVSSPVEQRNHVGPERLEERRVAKHRRDVDGQIEEQPLHASGVVEQPLEESGQRGEALEGDPPVEPPPKGCSCVLAEVEPVEAVDGLQQQVDLDGLPLDLDGVALQGTHL
jgi:hypothetical protein